MLKSTLKKSFLSLLACMAVSGAAVAAEPGIIVIGTDGSRQEIALASLDRISFGSSQLTVETKDAQNSSQYAYSAVDRILIGETVSSLASITAEGRVAVWPTVTSSTVSVAGAPRGTQLNVYGADGSLVTSAVAGDDITLLDLTGARTGVYIVTVGNQSVKIIKK